MCRIYRAVNKGEGAYVKDNWDAMRALTSQTKLFFMMIKNLNTMVWNTVPSAANKHNMVIDSPDRGLIVCGGLWVRDREESGRMGH